MASVTSLRGNPAAFDAVREFSEWLARCETAGTVVDEEIGARGDVTALVADLRDPPAAALGTIVAEAQRLVPDDFEHVDLWVHLFNRGGGRFRERADDALCVAVGLRGVVGENVRLGTSFLNAGALVPHELGCGDLLRIDGPHETATHTASAAVLYLAFAKPPYARGDPLVGFTGVVADPNKFYLSISDYYTDEDGHEYTHLVLKPKHYLPPNPPLYTPRQLAERFPGNPWLLRWENYMSHRPECRKVLLLRRTKPRPTTTSSSSAAS